MKQTDYNKKELESFYKHLESENELYNDEVIKSGFENIHEYESDLLKSVVKIAVVFIILIIVTIYLITSN